MVIGEHEKLNDIQSLKFYKGSLTTGRRRSPVPQLQCDPKFLLFTYSNCYKFQPSVVECYNRGNNGQNIQWECKADLPERIQFSSTKIACEGFEYPLDSYVLSGSCSLTYSLETKPARNFNEYYNQRDSYESHKLNNLLTIFIVITLILAIYKSCLKNRESSSTDLQNRNDTIPDPQSNTSGGALFPSPPPPYIELQNTHLANVYNNKSTIVHDAEKVDLPVNSQSLSPALQNVESVSSHDTNDNSWGGINGLEYNFNRQNRIGWSETTRDDSPPPAYEATTGMNENESLKELK